MTVQNILDQALYECHLKTAQVNAAQLIGWFNVVRRDLSRTIISDVSENFFFEIWTRDLIADREDGEYPFPIASTSIKGMSKLIGVAIKTTKDATDFTKAKDIDITAAAKDWDTLLRDQPKDEPVYFIGDNSVFIAPKYTSADISTPTDNFQLKLYGISRFEDLLATDGADKIIIPDDYQPLIAQGMQYYIYKSRNKINEAKACMADYTTGKFDMVDKLTNRDISTFQASIPDDTFLQS